MTTPRPVPPLHAELERLGELDADTLAAVQARRRDGAPDPLLGLPSDAQTFAEDPPERFVREVAARAAEAAWAERRRTRRFALRLALALGVAVVAVVSLRPAPTGVEDVLVKGSRSGLVAWRDVGGDAVPLVDGARAQAGDRVQLAFDAAGTTHGVLYSVDGRGVVTEHLRYAEPEPLQGRRVLKEAYVLDDAPGFEAFHLIADARAFDVDAVLAQARAAGATPVPPQVPEGRVVLSLRLEKAR